MLTQKMGKEEAVSPVIGVILMVALAVDPVDWITIWYYVFRFPGAIWYHWKNKER